MQPRKGERADSTSDGLVLTDKQLEVLAAYEDDGSECWYRHPCFKVLLAEGVGEFELMKALAQDLMEYHSRERDGNYIGEGE
jgi:hypothetical protein